MRQRSAELQDGDPPAGVLEPLWWVRGLTPPERPTDELGGHGARPEWAELAEHVVRVASSTPPLIDEGTDSWLDAFTRPLRPFVAAATDQLVSQVRSIPPQYADLPAVAEQFATHLGHRLARTAARTFVVELHGCRTRGELAGIDSRQRFFVFIQRLAEPAGLAALFGRYPVLARLLGETSLLAAEAHVELLTRYAADRATLVDSLMAGVDPGPIVAIETAYGDRHRRGRSVAVVSFPDGIKIVYKPRSLDVHIRLSGLVDWLNQVVPRLRLRTVAAVTGPGYGWLEFITRQPLLNEAEADRFYYRQGALLALLHAVHATDIHCENLVACGDQPVLIDAETVFHPTVPELRVADDPAARHLAESVRRTALLPWVMVGENGALDLSGLGGDQGLAPAAAVDWELAMTDQMRLTRRARTYSGSLSRPQFDDRDNDPLEHEAALIEGFRVGYGAIMAYRSELSPLIREFAGVETRLVARPTWVYASALEESTHPAVLRDAGDRDRFLSPLWELVADHPLRRQLVRHEAADLWAGDIPFLATRPASRDVWTATGYCLADLLESSGLDRVTDKLAAMCEADRRDQEWIIRAAMATRRPTLGHRCSDTSPGEVTGTAAEPGRLLAAACAIADEIMARGITRGPRLNWIGLELVDETQWSVLPMGAGLGNGYLGVALFLAQLADVTGVTRYGDAARRALVTVPSVCAELARQPDVVAAVGCGGLSGFGGISYALARLAVLLDDIELRDAAEAAVSLAAIAVESDCPPGVASGLAGCLAAMVTVDNELGLPSAARLAGVCADRLAEVAERTEGRCGSVERPSPAGFAHGAAGIGWALARFGRAGGGARHTAAAATVLSGIVPSTDPHTVWPDLGWCRGLAGVLASGASIPGVSAGLAADIPDPLLRSIVDRPVLRDLSLCHGELGVVEALTVLSTQDQGMSIARARRLRAGLVLDSIARYGPSCGTPNGVATPGLLTGLSGIGYGLLRLGFASRVPSVLLLEPRSEGT